MDNSSVSQMKTIDDEMSKIIIPKVYANILWRTSWCCLFSSIYAFYMKHFMLSFVPGCVFLVSINYWYHPDYSWRRYLDMIVVHLAIIYQTYYTCSYQFENFKISLLIMCFAIKFYLFGLYFYKLKIYWLSTYCHAIFHVIANIANVVLYSGKKQIF